MNREALLNLNLTRKLSLSIADLEEIKKYFIKNKRDITDLELEVIAQTWSEHCKHRIFNAQIYLKKSNKKFVIKGLFKTFIKNVTEKIIKEKKEFVLSDFQDNAGFIKIDEKFAAAFKVETHNHPSAIDPYSGANTGLGGVIRDILGAGKGAKPIANINGFCFGNPHIRETDIPKNIIHPINIMRAAVNGVSDYGNRTGIPTVAGVINFDEIFTYNPLVFCGSIGIISNNDINKKIYHTSINSNNKNNSLKIILVGAKTGKDGLKGATFASASLKKTSRIKDRSAVQIGNPIEEKKVMDFIIKARENNLIEYITDCGAGGLSSATGEMCKDTGGIIYLEKIPLKEEIKKCWEIFLSESQERMVLAIKNENKNKLFALGEIYEVECTEIGIITDSGKLEVYYNNNKICDLNSEFLHNPPRKKLNCNLSKIKKINEPTGSLNKNFKYDYTDLIIKVISDLTLCSREQIIRQYDFEVQGNTLLKPLMGCEQDCPSDGAVLRINDSDKCIAIGLSLLPEYGKYNPKNMGKSCVDDAVKKIITIGANPDKIALLDNFCAGDISDETELVNLILSVQGMAEIAKAYKTPFISGKDSFYNFYVDEHGKKKSIPITLLVSAIGIVENINHIILNYIKSGNSYICITGITNDELGGSVLYKKLKFISKKIPNVKPVRSAKLYNRYYECIKKELILSAHNISEGGFAAAIIKMAFSLKSGIEIDINNLPVKKNIPVISKLFSESSGRIIFEIKKENLEIVKNIFDTLPFAVIGNTTVLHNNIIFKNNESVIFDKPICELKNIWKKPLEQLY